MVPKSFYTGIFFTALATLMFEILLTRIFSVSMGYHFAFMAISIAMFGMTVGAIIVYIFPKRYSKERAVEQLTKNSFLFSLTIILGFFFHIYFPFVHSLSITGLLSVGAVYAVISVPFVFSGICISLLLTKFHESVNKLYAADLFGAAAGCILVVEAIDLTGGPGSVLIASLFASLAALTFSYALQPRRMKIYFLFTFLLISFTVINAVFTSHGNPLIRLYWVRGEWNNPPLYEKWNSFTRVSIDGDSTAYEVPFGWGLSNKYDRSRKVRQLMLNIDAHSTTVISEYSGNTDSLFHLKYDISNIVHYLRKDADVLIIGSGGGRDILSCFAFGQKSMLGIEINRDMLKALNGEFGDFTGHLDKYPNVKFVGDEARSYIQRHNDKYDIIQVSVIDNWSATSSGAFVLTENALYTLENWKLMIDRLNPDGILTITRFYRSKPAEVYRLVSISVKALQEAGINDLRENIIVLRMFQNEREKDRSGTGVVLVSKKPFSKNDLKTIDSVCSVMAFEKVLTPETVLDSAFAKIVSDDYENFVSGFPVDISPPTDNKPFFFHLLKFSDVFNNNLWKNWDMEFNVKAIFILYALIGTMLLLTLLCIIVPLKLTSKNFRMKGSGRFFIYFASIGFGFMLIEISQIQRLNIFLGHPTYSIAASLFTLLLSSGLGSYAGSKAFINFSRRRILINFVLLLLILSAFGMFTGMLIDLFRAETSFIRITLACIILFPLGFFMGTAFPLGIKSASKQNDAISPWLWGINGLTSVFASVLAVVIAMTYGISASYWTGLAFYLIAVLSFSPSLSKN